MLKKLKKSAKNKAKKVAVKKVNAPTKTKAKSLAAKKVKSSAKNKAKSVAAKKAKSPAKSTAKKVVVKKVITSTKNKAKTLASKRNKASTNNKTKSVKAKKVKISANKESAVKKEINRTPIANEKNSPEIKTHGEDLHFIPELGEKHPITTFEVHKAENKFHHREEVAFHQENQKIKAAMPSRKGMVRFNRNKGR